ncbi:MAG: pyridoxamine 5'-phosphate oxidase family protein [Alphaproteobacteria bacterium]|nr:pyridoxamine 5'-phosphate oxidase family protein [Alphaproteobacteria bacterium]
MAKIPTNLWDAFNNAFPASVVLVGTALPDGFVQVSPRGSALIYDDETIAFWSRGHGHTHDNMSDGDKVTVFFRDPELRASGALPRGGIARFYGTASIHTDGPAREAVWERMIEQERTADSDKKGYAVLIAVERAEDLAHEPLDA